MKLKANTSIAIAAAAAASCRFDGAHAFQQSACWRSRPHSHSRAVAAANKAPSSTTMFAKKKKGGSGKGFQKPKYSIKDKSYGIPPPSPSISSSEQTPEEAHSSMSEFFATHDDWKPLFRGVMNAGAQTSPPASCFLSDAQRPQELWGISTLENRNPWRLLPSKPTSDSSLQTLSAFLDEWQRSLLDIPLDEIVTGENDLHFLEEGRRTIAVTRFHVLDEYYDSGASEGGGTSEEAYDWETELFRTAWSEMAHLMSQDVVDTGSLVLLPDRLSSLGQDDNGENVGGLDSVRDFVERNLIRPLHWLGRHDDWEIAAMERGSLAVRLLYKLGDIPDLSERDRSGDEDVKL